MTEFFENYRSGVEWRRKASEWSAPLVVNVDVLNAVARLPVFQTTEASPIDDFVEAAGSQNYETKRPQYFVAALADGRRFVVDTQGYAYARYIAQLPPSPVATMNSAAIIDVRKADGKNPTTVYVRIPAELARPIDGGCSCDYCKAHPTEVPKWDCLAVPVTDTNDHAWTVHYPTKR